MKKTIIAANLILILLLAGCGHIHSHSWLEANFQEPMRCPECGETLGDPLEADFSVRKISADLKENEPAEFHTVTGEEKLDTTGVFTITGSEILTEDASHKKKNGYEWHIIRMSLSFSDENSINDGFDYNYLISDFYDIEGFKHSFVYDQALGCNTFTVNWYGKDYPECRESSSISRGEWEKSGDGFKKTVEITWTLLLPEGYDGIVVGVRSSGIDTEGKHYIYEYYEPDAFLLYRVGGSK